MKKQLFVYSILLITLSAFSQKQFTHIATKANNSCNGDCTLLDNAELNDNPSAVIWVTPLIVNGPNLNPHPIGVYYFKNKWNVFNLDQKPIPEGSKFMVEYVARADDSHFQYSFTREDIQADGSALIDHPALNNNPTAKFSSFPSWNPAQGVMANREEIRIQYNNAAGKWSMSNSNQKSLFARVTYNISISGPGRVIPQIATPHTSVVIKELTVTPTANPTFGAVATMYMTAWADGIKLPGDNIRVAHLDKTEVISLEMGATNLAVRKNTYDPFTIRIYSGYPMGLPLLNAFIKKQAMVFTIDAIITDQKTGREVINYTIKLTGAYISSYKQLFDREQNPTLSKNQPEKSYDEIKITFTKIEYTNSAGATAVDNQ